MTYRAGATADLPLVVTHGQLLVAVDPANGQLRWQQRLASAATRLFRIRERLLVGDTSFRADDARLRCFDLRTGAPLGDVALGFGIDTGLVHEDRLYVGGASGFACLTSEGKILWRAKLVLVEQGWTANKTSLVCTDAAGNELWRTDDPGSRHIGDGIGMLIEQLSAQPDLWGTRD